MTRNYDVEFLISLVQARPVIWNKTSSDYKDKTLTKNAWREIFKEIDSDYDSMREKEKEEFGKEIVRKWWNVRDTYVRSCRKRKEVTKSGTCSIRKYIFADHLQFLNVNNQERGTDHSVNDAESPEHTQEESNENEAIHSVFEVEVDKEPRSVPKKRKIGPMYSRVVDILEKQQNRHLCFFKGILPSLDDFNEDEVVRFQMGVLQLISKLRQKRMAHGNQQSNWLNHEESSAWFRTEKRETTSPSVDEGDPL